LATLIIWNNHVYPWSSYPGHAALNITDDWARNAQASCYVSWWPDDGEKWKPRATPQLNLSQDLALEGYAPDHILHIPNMLRGRMMSKWSALSNDPSKVYRFLRQNCSTIVGQVLKEGSQLGSSLQRNNLVWTPLKCLRLGKAMGGVEVPWTTFLNQLKKAGYFSNSDVAVLANLFKRDVKHGKNATGNNAYYGGGRKLHDKPVLQWHGQTTGKGVVGGKVFQSFEGSIFSSGSITAINDRNADVDWTTQDKPL
jgi:hypothetical protein